MEFLTIFFIAIALGMDAFAVSIVSGTTLKKLHPKHVLRIALFFGGFQGIMPILGWGAGNGFRDLIQGIDHWIAFGLLFFIGSKMIYESTKLELDERMDPLNMNVLLILSIATSIDAFGVGLGLSILDASIMFPALVIAFVTFSLSVLGLFIGDTFGHHFEKKMELLGGVILIIIGFSILIEHIL